MNLELATYEQMFPTMIDTTRRGCDINFKTSLMLNSSLFRNRLHYMFELSTSTSHGDHHKIMSFVWTTVG
jgi:hypothetical protein